MAIQVSELYQILLDSIRADSRGLTVEVDEFNRAVKIVNIELFEKYLENFEEGTENIDSMGVFKVHNRAVDLSTISGQQVGTLPTNYYYLIGKPRITSDNSSTGTVYRCDLVTAYEDAEREDDYLTKASLAYPTVMIGGEDTATGDLQIRVRPSTTTKVWIDYLREPDEPYLDYMINNTTYVKTFFADTSVAKSVPAGYTHSSGTVGGTGVTVTSLTQDLEWGTEDIPLLIAMLMKKMGFALPDQVLAEAGITEEVNKTKE